MSKGPPGSTILGPSSAAGTTSWSGSLPTRVRFGETGFSLPLRCTRALMSSPFWLRRLVPFLIPLVALALPNTAGAQNDERKVLGDAGAVFEEMMDMREKAIPPALLDDARAVAVIPGVVKGAFFVGGRRGRGVLLTRRDDQSWSAPAFLTLTGGSFGFQIGGSSTDVILVFLNHGSVESLVDGKITLGGNASVAAGPVGRNAEAVTDGRLKAEIYSYSRSRGAFVGVALEGADLDFSESNNEAMYGEGVSVHDILYGSTPSPDGAQHLRALLAEHSP